MRNGQSFINELSELGMYTLKPCCDPYPIVASSQEHFSGGHTTGASGLKTVNVFIYDVLHQ